MARRRFLVEQIRDNTAEVRGADARHVARVLRAVPGQQYEISDGAAVYLAEIASVEKDRVAFRVVAALESARRTGTPDAFGRAYQVRSLRMDDGKGYRTGSVGHRSCRGGAQ